MSTPLSSEQPGALDFKEVAGDTLGRLLTFTLANGDPANVVATYTIVSAEAKRGITIFEFDVTSPADNQINLALTAEQTAAMGVGSWTWALVWQEPGDIVRTALQGFVKLTKRYP